MKVYNITKGQLITLWIFGGIGMFWALVQADSYSTEDRGIFFLWFIPLVLIFYTIGWKNYKKNKPSNSYEHLSEDDLYEEVKNLVIKEQKASTSFIQRKLGIGYARAARLMDVLEENGVIGEGRGAEPRNVIIKE
ncbi:MAG: DNA translocase FtsK [Minisyncoccia bacterium]